MTQSQNKTDIDVFYQSLKTSSPESGGIRFGTWCINKWRESSFLKSGRSVAFLKKLAGFVYKDNVGTVLYGVQHILENEEQYKKLYSLLCDEKSRRTLMSILTYRANGDRSSLCAESDPHSNQYFADDIMQFTNHEVFVDCGGYNGDTAEHFINRVPEFSRIYFYEPDIDNYHAAEQRFSAWEGDVCDKLTLRNAGVGKESATLRLSSGGAGSQVSAVGDQKVQIVSLDDDISEPVSFIKMDIEGFELDAIEGAKNHIRQDKPKLAICVYHKPNDLWQVPERILELDPSYTLYLRRYDAGEQDQESVIYAI